MYDCGIHEREESTASYSILTISASKGMEYSPITLFPNTSNIYYAQYSFFAVFILRSVIIFTLLLICLSSNWNMHIL